MNHQLLSTPWEGRSPLYSAPGSLIVKLALGEAPAAIPTALDVRIGAQPSAAKLTVGAVDRLIRHFADAVRISRVHTAAASLGNLGHQHERFDDLEQAIGLSRTFRIQADRHCPITDLVDALRQLTVVEQAYPHYLSALPFTAAAPTLSIDLESAWHSRQQIATAEALAYEPGDPAVIVAIVDTGVLPTHPELQRHLRSGMDTVQLAIDDLAAGLELVGDRSTIDAEPDDLVGHGTSCAAIVGAIGAHLPPGLAGDCGILPIRVLGAAKFPGKPELMGIGAIADIDLGVKRAIDLGAKVINMSFGTPESALEATDPRPHTDVVRYGLARGCILVAASGNSGKTERFLPAALPGVIAIGAIDAADQPTRFSTRGDHVAVCAPGERVASAGLGGYSLVTGTSFAAPFAAATAGLLVSRAARRSIALDGETVRRILIQSAQPWAIAPDGCGAGILNAHAALQQLDREIDRSDYSGLSPPASHPSLSPTVI